MATGQELATAYLSLTVSARGINKDIAKELSGLDKEAEKTGKSSGGAFSSAFKGALSGVAAALSVGAITKFVGSTVQGAGDMEQSLGALDSVFKGSSGQMKAWSGNAATNVGLAGNEFNELGVLIGSQLKNGGTAMEDLAPKTHDLIALGADLSSMFGGSTKEAVESLSSALKGERDPIEKYGVSLNQSKIDAEAAALGFEKVGGSLSSEATQAATMSLIMKQTADAHGNFAAESDTFAHKQQVMAAKWEDLKVKIGEKFMPVLSDAFGFISDKAIPGLEGFGDGLAEVGQWIKDNAAWLVPLTAGLVAYAGAVGALSIISTMKGWLAAAQGAQWGLNAAMSANPVGLIIAGITILVAGLIWFFTQTEIGQKIVTVAWGAIKTAVAAVSDWFQNTLMPAIAVVLQSIGAIFTWLYENIVKPVFGFIGAIISTWWTVTKGIFQLVVAVLRYTLGAAFSWLWESIIKPVFGFIGSLISTWWSGVKIIFDAVTGFLRSTFGPAFTWLRDNVISPVWNGITDIISSVWNNGVKPVFEALRGFIMDTIPNAFRTGVDAVKTAWEKLKDIAKAPVKFVVDTVINGGLIAAFNKIAGVLPGIDKLPNVALPAGFANGGYTGDGGKYQPAGIVHAGEYVFTKEETRKAGVGNLSRLAQTLRGYATGGLVHPLPGFGINSGFGRNGTDPSHTGADFAAPTGTPVLAAGPGVVTQAAWSNYGGGNEVKVNHPNGLQTWYSHLSSILARLGQSVMAGQTVGRVGSTGNSTGPHLHYTVMRDGQYVDPAGYLAGGGVGGSSGSGGAAPTNPLENVLDGLVSKFKDKFPAGGMFADMAIGAGKKIFTDAKDWVSEKLGGIKDTVKNVVQGAGRMLGIGNAGAPTVYDGGGWLEKTGAPQLVHHRKSKPDAVLSSEQWGTMTRIAENSGGAGGGVTINGDVYGATPEQIVSEWDTKQRRAATMHNLRKVMVG